MRPAALAMWATAAVFSGMILFNAFYSQNTSLRLADVPPGASTRVSVSVPGKTSRTITLKYDETVEDVQRELLALGRFQGLVDGVSGPQTRIAIEAYQREKNMDVTGEASPQLLEHIRYTRKLAQAAEFTGSIAPPTAQQVVAEPQAALEQPDAVPAPKKAEAAPAGTADKGDKAILKVQQRLKKLGYDPGKLSGAMDEGTRSAILIFEMDHGLTMDGTISKPLLSALKQAESQQASGQ